MDVTGYLLTSGFAILVVLLGWSKEITSKSKETKELEADFIKKANMKGANYKAIIDKAGSTKESFNMLVEFLYSQNRNKEDIEIFEKIKNIRKAIADLDKEYGWRFWLLLITAGFLFITGIQSFFLENKHLALIPNISPIILIFKNLIVVHVRENKYYGNILQIMEKL